MKYAVDPAGGTFKVKSEKGGDPYTFFVAKSDESEPKAALETVKPGSVVAVSIFSKGRADSIRAEE